MLEARLMNGNGSSAARMQSLMLANVALEYQIQSDTLNYD